jgi:DNA-binding transcriptional LysR family regulator
MNEATTTLTRAAIDSRLSRPNLKHEVLVVDTMEVVVGPTHALAQCSEVNWTVLQDYPWIVPPLGTLMHERLGSALVAAGISIMPRVESGSLIMVEALLRSTPYVSVLAGLVARHLQDLGILRIVAMREPQAFGTIGVVWDSGNVSPMMEQFISVLRAQAGAVVAERRGPRS